MGRRFAELDGLRGIAAVTVAIAHLWLHFQLNQDFTNAPAWMNDIGGAVAFYAGILPVALFFMVSGFVIYMTLERCARPLDFAVSRATRLYPTYWAAILLTLSVIAVDFAGRGLVMPAAGEVAVNITMLQEFLGADHLDPVYWSLTYELRFYLFFAVIWFTPLRRFLDYILFFWLALAFAGALVWPELREVPFWATQANLPYAQFFIAGIGFYRLWKGERSTMLLALTGGAALVCLLQRPVLPGFIAIAFWGVFYLAVTGRLRLAAAGVLTWLGRISYALYLVHLPLGVSVVYWLNSLAVPAPLAIAAGLGAALAAASLITYFVERPSLKWSRRLYRAWQEQQRQETEAQILDDKRSSTVS